jgi:hypothetical protein
MRLFLLEGDAERIRDLVERTLTAPARALAAPERGVVEFRPLGGHVLLAVGESYVASQTCPERGSVREALACFWVPVWSGCSQGERFEARHLCMSVPHILVDNPISHAAGREIYGYPKALARFEPERDFLNGRLVIRGFGGTFATDTKAAWLPLLEITPTSVEAEPGPELDGTTGLVRELLDELLGTDGLPDLGEESFELLDGVRVMVSAIREALEGRMRQVFLKQFRDASDQQLACYQALVEVTARTTHVKRRPSRRDWDITIRSLDSHPVGSELGLAVDTPQRATWSVEVREYEFEVDPGEVIAP